MEFSFFFLALLWGWGEPVPPRLMDDGDCGATGAMIGPPQIPQSRAPTRRLTARATSRLMFYCYAVLKLATSTFWRYALRPSSTLNVYVAF
jgi:hypothetical protein